MRLPADLYTYRATINGFDADTGEIMALLDFGFRNYSERAIELHGCRRHHELDPSAYADVLWACLPIATPFAVIIKTLHVVDNGAIARIFAPPLGKTFPTRMFADAIDTMSDTDAHVTYYDVGGWLLANGFAEPHGRLLEH